MTVADLLVLLGETSQGFLDAWCIDVGVEVDVDALGLRHDELHEFDVRLQAVLGGEHGDVLGHLPAEVVVGVELLDGGTGECADLVGPALLLFLFFFLFHSCSVNT